MLTKPDDLTFITSDSIDAFHGGPYQVTVTKTNDPACGVTFEAELSFNGMVARRVMGNEIMFPILLLHAINDHQREINGSAPPEPQPLTF